MPRFSFALVVALALALALALGPLAAFAEPPASSTFYENQIGPGLVRLKNRETLNLLGAGAIAIALARTQDEEMRDAWRDNQRMSPEIANYGDKFGVYAISAVIAGGQYLFDRNNSYHHMRSLVAVTVLWTHLFRVCDGLIAATNLRLEDRRVRLSSRRNRWFKSHRR